MRRDSRLYMVSHVHSFRPSLDRNPNISIEPPTTGLQCISRFIASAQYITPANPEFCGASSLSFPLAHPLTRFLLFSTATLPLRWFYPPHPSLPFLTTKFPAAPIHSTYMSICMHTRASGTQRYNFPHLRFRQQRYSLTFFYVISLYYL
jgi:hypothetical protein